MRSCLVMSGLEPYLVQLKAKQCAIAHEMIGKKRLGGLSEGRHNAVEKVAVEFVVTLGKEEKTCN